jgi:acyl-coenzyme A synthetase/AMP-(fatty) acid ligase
MTRVPGTHMALMDSTWQNVTDPIFHFAETRPEAPALIEGHRTINYRDLASLVAKASVYHANLGIEPGQRVCVSMTNSINHFVLSLGLLRLGATLMPAPYTPQQPPAVTTLAKFAIRMLFLEPGVPAPMGYRALTVEPSTWLDNIAKLSGDRRFNGSGDEIYTISLTSGTTGTPKGSLTSHLQYFTRLKAYTELLGDSGAFSADNPANFLLTANIGFTTFFRRMISHLIIGGPVVILPEYLHVVDLVKAIAVWENALCFVPTALCRVLIACAPAQGLLFPKLRVLAAGGGSLYAEDKLRVLARVTPNFYEFYGASGFGTLSVLPPSVMREKAESVGRAPSFVEIEVVDPQGNRMPPGAVGRLRCRGSESKGFAAENDVEGDERFRDGWYYPGDIGYLDTDGYIFLKGRTVDLIQRPGGDIFSSDIESVIAQHPSVQEVAAVGLPRAGGPGEEIVAVVVTRGEAQHEALAQHCRTKLPPERWPDRVFYTQSLPKTPGGKLDRMAVKTMANVEMKRRAGLA